MTEPTQPDAVGAPGSPTDGPGIVSATIFLDRPMAPNLQRLTEHFGAVLGIDGGKQGAMGFLATVPGGPLMAMVVDQPPVTSGQDLASIAVWWPEAEAALAKSQARVVVMCPWSAGTRLEAHIKHTIVVRDLLAQLPGAIGVQWSNMLVSTEQFNAAYLRFQTEHIVPVQLWVLIQLTVDGQGRTVASTFGMEKFGLMDIEVDGAPVAPEAMATLVESLANYLIQRGPVIEAGDLAGGDDGGPVARVSIGPSFRAADRHVYRLAFEDATGQTEPNQAAQPAG